MKTKDFYYELPQELIAQVPLADRSASRLMHLNRKDKTISHDVFRNIVDYFCEGDCLVLNDTRVIPARLYGKRIDTGGAIEFLLLHKRSLNEWEVITAVAFLSITSSQISPLIRLRITGSSPSKVSSKK